MPGPVAAGSTLEALKEALLRAGSQLRYGVSPEEKLRLQYARALPGAPNPGDPTAERYTSAYLGAEGRSPLFAAIFNMLAAEDTGDALSEQRKAAGRAAIEMAGARRGPAYPLLP